MEQNNASPGSTSRNQLAVQARDERGTASGKGQPSHSQGGQGAVCRGFSCVDVFMVRGQ